MNRIYLIVILFFNFFPFITAGRSVGSSLQYLTREHNCSFIKNVETDDDFAGHQYIVAENCLYYNLQDKSNNGQRASPSLLQISAPTTNANRTVMNVKNLEIMKVYMEDGQTKATIKGNFKLSWYDQRVKWNVDEWKLNSLRIMSSSHIWNPGFYPSRSTSNHEFGFASLQSLIAYPNGTVSGRVDMNIHSPCEVDFTDFPHDQHECCFNLYSPNFQSVIQYQLDTNRGDLSPRLSSAGWTPKNIQIQIEREDITEDQRLHICVSLARDVGNLKIELSLPMSVASMVWLISCLFGNLKRQIFVKLFALLLEFLCFQFLVQRTPNVGVGYNTPKIFQYYEFTIAITLANILTTLLFYALSNKERTGSPSSKLYSFFQRLNLRIYCCNGSDDEQHETKQIEEQSKESLVQQEWSEIFVGFNVIFSIITSIGYLIGITIIFCWQ